MIRRKTKCLFGRRDEQYGDVYSQTVRRVSAKQYSDYYCKMLPEKQIAEKNR